MLSRGDDDEVAYERWTVRRRRAHCTARHERFLVRFGELRRIHSFIDCRAAELTVSRRAQDVTRNRFSLEFRNYLQKYALSGVEVLVSSGFGL